MSGMNPTAVQDTIYGGSFWKMTVYLQKGEKLGNSPRIVLKLFTKFPDDYELVSDNLVVDYKVDEEGKIRISETVKVGLFTVTLTNQFQQILAECVEELTFGNQHNVEVRSSTLKEKPPKKYITISKNILTNQGSGTNIMAIRVIPREPNRYWLIHSEVDTSDELFVYFNTLRVDFAKIKVFDPDLKVEVGNLVTN